MTLADQFQGNGEGESLFGVDLRKNGRRRIGDSIENYFEEF